MQIKGKRHPVSVYEAFTPAAAESLPDKPPRRARFLAEGSADTHGIMRHEHSVQSLPAHAQTPLIGADFMLSQVPGERLSLMST